MNVSENFPEISFIDNTTIDDLLEQMIKDYQDKYKEITGKEAVLTQANPYRLILYASAMQIYQAMQYADYAGKMSFLRYSREEFLDNLAALRGITRRGPTAAVTVLQFSIDEPLTFVVPIPAGCRVTNGHDIFFATDEYAEIKAGETSVKISATCTETGGTGNDIAVGALKILVNTLSHITAVSNIVATYGGGDRETDEDLKDRIFAAPNGYSTTGPTGAYEYYTKSVSQDIGDVIVRSEIPGEVDVYLIMKDGTIPEEDMIQRVKDRLDDRTIRPLTDKVFVRPPMVQNYDVSLTYYIAESSKAAVSAIQAGVDTAVLIYNMWQTEKIGRDINPSYLIQKVMEAGAKRVEVESPVFTILHESTVAKTGTVTVKFGGVEND